MDFQNNFTAGKPGKFPTKPTQYFPPCLQYNNRSRRRHEAAAATVIFTKMPPVIFVWLRRRRQSYSSKSKSVIFHVAAAPLNWVDC